MMDRQPDESGSEHTNREIVKGLETIAWLLVIQTMFVASIWVILLLGW